MNRLALAFLILVAPTQMGAGCDPLVLDSSFELWCGERLCAWSVDEGEIRRVPTWHEKDSGVELVGPAVRLSQRADLDENRAKCLRFELSADIADGATLALEMDFLDDGSVEYSQPVPAARWSQLRYHVTPPTWFSGVRFAVRKYGPARAVVARLDVEPAPQEDCATPAVALPDRPPGAKCVEAAECASARCLPVAGGLFDVSICEGCTRDADCPAGQACGVEAGPGVLVHRACGAPARHALGERCSGGLECATGVCCGGVCSECCDGAPCADGSACTDTGSTDLVRRPRQCGGGRAAGAACFAGRDCSSGRCTGSARLGMCPGDGRRCEAPEDCPGRVFGAEFECTVVGELEGRCE